MNLGDSNASNDRFLEAVKSLVDQGPTTPTDLGGKTPTDRLERQNTDRKEFNRSRRPPSVDLRSAESVITPANTPIPSTSRHCFL